MNSSVKILMASLWVLSLLTITFPAISENKPISTADISNTGIIEALETTRRNIQYVNGDRIFDENGSEVIWRGTGGSYLFHTEENYQEAWEKHLPEIKAMSLNTIRLSFAFAQSVPKPDSGNPSADIIDFEKLNWVLNFLDQNGVKAILDLHNYLDMDGDFGSQKIIDNWVEVAAHYQGDSRIVAYELFNEPYWKTWDKTWMTDTTDVVKAYAQLTDAIRQVDPEHIIIWSLTSYLPAEFPDGFEEYVRQSIVYSIHRGYRASDRDKRMFELWTPEEMSYIAVGCPVEVREKLNAPVWVGEFGSHAPMNEVNPEYLLVEQILFRCEEQAIGWNLWIGYEGFWDDYSSFFPLKVYNQDLVRQSWKYLALKLTDYLIDQQGVDRLEPYLIEMRQNKDYVTLKAGIIILVLRNRVNPDGTIDVVSEEGIYLTNSLTIRHEEYTEENPCNITTRIYTLRYR